MLAAYCSTNEESSCFKLLGTVKPTNEGGLISNNTSLISSALASGDVDSCSFYSGPSDATIMAFGESAETAGTIAYGGSAMMACSGETAGSIASSGGSVSTGGGGGGFSGGGCFA